jgi:hypothetical protein
MSHQVAFSSSSSFFFFYTKQAISVRIQKMSEVKMWVKTVLNFRFSPWFSSQSDKGYRSPRWETEINSLWPKTPPFRHLCGFKFLASYSALGKELKIFRKRLTLSCQSLMSHNLKCSLSWSIYALLSSSGIGYCIDVLAHFKRSSIIKPCVHIHLG